MYMYNFFSSVSTLLGYWLGDLNLIPEEPDVPAYMCAGSTSSVLPNLIYPYIRRH